jgi:hypothetical protein
VGWEEVVYQEMSNNIYQHDSYWIKDNQLHIDW